MDEANLITKAYVLVSRYLPKNEASELIAMTLHNAICDAEELKVPISQKIYDDFVSLISILEGQEIKKAS